MSHLTKPAALALTAASLVSAPALAGGVNVQTHTSTANTSYTKTETARLGYVNGTFLGLDYNYSDEPLVVLSPDRDRRLGTLIESIHTLDLTVGEDFGGKFSLNASLPLNLMKDAAGQQTFSLGEARAFMKVPLLRRSSRFQLALVPEMRVPLGGREYFLADEGAGFGAMLAAERDFGIFSLAANLGYRYSSGARFREMDYRHRLPMSLGLTVPVTRSLALNSEVSGFRVLPYDGHQNPGEFYGGLRYQFRPDMMLTGGAALGATNGVASADYRVLFGLRFTPQPAVRDEVRAGQAAVEFTPTEIRINDEILFAHDSARLLKPSHKILNQVGRVIRENLGRFRRIDIEGHCNELGTDAYNLELGSRRAASVKAYLVRRGIQEDILNPMSFGERQPKVLPGKAPREERLRLNRRVEFKVIQ